jgi:hypothetical protein
LNQQRAVGKEENMFDILTHHWATHLYLGTLVVVILGNLLTRRRAALVPVRAKVLGQTLSCG